MRRPAILLMPVAALLALALFATAASAAAPVVLKTSFSGVTTTSATLEGEIDPETKATQYHFEYGLADCATTTCTSTPKGSIPSGDDPVAVTPVKVEGLTPGTTYHFRLVAQNSEGKDEGFDRTFTTFGPPPVFGPCPNDFLRTKANPMAQFIEYLGVNLPDCRGYEQASPVDKNGVDVKGLAAWVKAASDGSAASFMTTSGIPGGEGAQELPPSLSRRGTNDWSTKGMLPPASYGAEAFVLGWTPDFSYVFSAATRLVPARATALLSRSADGEITEVVPHTTAMNSAPAFAGASADGSVVVFESTAKLLEEAIAGASNVYVWERSSEELRLAGVLNDESAPEQGAFAGPYDWGLGDAGLTKGGSAFDYYTQDQRAVSADGSRIYFTAAGKGKGELYLRLNPTEPQSPLDLEGNCTDPDLACTIEVSASQRSTPDPAGERPAAFMGASADGQLAYFTSPEKLTDDSYTGPEQKAPAIARAPIDDGDPKDLEFEPATAAGIAIDSEFIYWANPEDDTIERAPLDGTGDPEVLVSGLENPQYVALDSTSENIYWSATGPLDPETGKPQDGLGTIGRAEVGPSGLEDPDPDFITGATNPQGVAVNATHVYWANGGDETETRTIGRAILGLTEAEEVEQNCIEVGESAQKFTPQGIAINATHIYAAINGTQAFSYLFRWDLDCDTEASRILIFDSQHIGLEGLRGLAIDSEFVYWAREGQDSIGRIPLADITTSGSCASIPTCKSEWIEEAGFPIGLAVNASNVFWSANQGIRPNPGNDLYRYEAATGELTDLTVDPTSVEKGADVQGVVGISDDGLSVYFVANGVLAAGATLGDCEGTFTDASLSYSGQCNLYLARDGEPTRLITRLDAEGLEFNSDATNWAPHGATSRNLPNTARITPDGNTIVFRSQRQLTAYDNEGTPMLYRWQVGDIAPSCISCNPTGEASIGQPSFGSIGLAALTPAKPAYVLSRNLSADGNRVFFEATDPLVGADTNGAAKCPVVGPIDFAYRLCQDVYEWEAQGTGSCKENVQAGGCLYLLSDGSHDEASFFADASLDGDQAFLITSSKLVGQDQDELYDLYRAGVGDGLASQNQPPPPDCTSLSSCQPAPPAPPSFQSPATPEFTGPGNVKEAKKRRCPKGKRKARVKGKVRCVRKGKGKARRRAGHNRRASR